MFFACSLLYGYLRTFYDFLRTFLRTKHIFLRTIIASIYECDFREENHMVVDHFKRYFKYTLYILHALILSLTHQKIGLLIKFWLIYGVF